MDVPARFCIRAMADTDTYLLAIPSGMSGAGEAVMAQRVLRHSGSVWKLRSRLRAF